MGELKEIRGCYWMRLSDHVEMVAAAERRQADQPAACPHNGEVWAPEHVSRGQWDPRVPCGQLGQKCPACMHDAMVRLAKALEASRA